MAFDIVVRDRIQQSIVTKIGKIKVEAKSTVTWVTRLRAQLNGLGARTGLTGLSGQLNKIGSNLRRTNRQITLMSSGFTRAANAGRRLLSGALLLSAADGFLDSLDAFQNIQNRLKGVSEVVDFRGIRNATASQERLNEVTRQLFDVANRARVPVSELAKTYRRLDIALNNVGASQQESIRITETVSKLLSLSGANAGEAASSLLQLSQAFNKGKLDGDEFRSVAELMPSAIAAISDVLRNKLGGSFTNIYDAAEKGLITIEVMRKAFANLAKQVDDDFTRLPRTIGQAFTQLINEITKAFGSSANAGSFLSQIINFIDWIKNNLPTVVQLMKSFVAVMAVQTIGLFVSQLGSVSGWLNLIAQGVSGLIGYFTFWSDQIKVSTDGLVTLQDVFVSLYRKVREWLSTGKGFFGSIFSAEGAQTAWGWVMWLFDNVRQGIYMLASAFYSVYQTIVDLGWDKIWDFNLEAQDAAFQWLVNKFIDFTEWLLGLFERTLNRISSMVFTALKNIAESLSRFVKKIPLVGQALGELDDQAASLFGTLAFQDTFDFTDPESDLIKFLESYRKELKDITPIWQEIFNTENLETGQQSGLLERHFREGFNALELQYKNFSEEIMRMARENANFRIDEEERVRRAFEPNRDALRQGGRGNAVQFFGRGAKRRTKQQGNRTTIAGDNTERGNAVQFFGRNARKRWEDSVGGANKSQALNNFSNRVRKEIEVVKSLERSTENVSRSRSSIDNVNNSVAELSKRAKALSFDEPRLSVDRYEVQATQSLRKLSNVNFDVADHIERKQTQAWRNAKSEVEDFANYAMKVLMRIAELREMARPRTDAWGRPAASRGFMRAPGGVPIEINRRNRDGIFIGSGSSGRQPNFNTQWDSWGPTDGQGRGFASGGYTGSGRRNRVAGVVHGQEYVMPADATAKYRPLLDAMRQGTSMDSSTGSGVGITINIENYANATHEVQQISANEVRIIARDAVQTGAVSVIARELSQPNSVISKSINHNLRSQRRR